MVFVCERDRRREFLQPSQFRILKCIHAKRHSSRGWCLQESPGSDPHTLLELAVWACQQSWSQVVLVTFLLVMLTLDWMEEKKGHFRLLEPLRLSGFVSSLFPVSLLFVTLFAFFMQYCCFVDLHCTKQCCPILRFLEMCKRDIMSYAAVYAR